MITQRCLKSSIVMTTNLGVSSWGQIFDDPMVAAAMLDRLLLVFNIDGASYRMRSHRARSEALQKAVMPTKKSKSRHQLTKRSTREFRRSTLGSFGNRRQIRHIVTSGSM